MAVAERCLALETDRRLLGCQPYCRDIEDHTHAEVRQMLKSDFADFLAQPRQEMLGCVIGLLLSYQDSVLAGARRKRG